MLRIARSKILIVLIILLISAGPVCAAYQLLIPPLLEAVMLRTIAVGAARTAAANGARLSPLLIEIAKKTAQGGVYQTAQRGWIYTSLSAAQRSKMLGWALLGGSAVGAVYDIGSRFVDLKALLAQEYGWTIDEEGNIMKPSEDITAFTDDRAFTYYLTVILPAISSLYRSPHSIMRGGVFATQAEAQAAAQVKQAAITADPLTTATTITIDTPYLVGPGQYAPECRVGVYQVGSTVNSTGIKTWYYYAYPFSGTSIVPVVGDSVAPTQEELEEALEPLVQAQTGPAVQAVEQATQAIEEFFDDDLARRNTGRPPVLADPWRPGATERPADDYERELANGIPDDAWESFTDTAQTVPADSFNQPVQNPDAEQTPDVTPHTTCAAERFQQFLDNIKGSELGGMYGSMFGSVPTGGACEWQVDAGQTFGGTHTMNWCGWAQYLSIFKAALLIVVGFVAFRIVMGGK